jgi:hypothetical protein
VLARTIAERLALRMLAGIGNALIGNTRAAAGAAEIAGKVEVAASLMEIAEAAERLCAVRETTRRIRGGYAWQVSGGDADPKASSQRYIRLRPEPARKAQDGALPASSCTELRPADDPRQLIARARIYL